MINFKLLIIVFCLIFVFAVQSQASTIETINAGLQNTRLEAGYPDPGSGPNVGFVSVWSVYVNGFIIMMGVLFLILMIYGGWLWMTAQGKEEQVKKGKDIIIQASIGLLVVIVSRLIVEFLFTQFGQASLNTDG